MHASHVLRFYLCFPSRSGGQNVTVKRLVSKPGTSCRIVKSTVRYRVGSISKRQEERNNASIKESAHWVRSSPQPRVIVTIVHVLIIIDVASGSQHIWITWVCCCTFWWAFLFIQGIDPHLHAVVAVKLPLLGWQTSASSCPGFVRLLTPPCKNTERVTKYKISDFNWAI